MLGLMTFVISHFSEKARWALDFEGLSFEERRLIPGLHIPSVRRLASESTVPVLVHEGRAVQGSSAILDYLETGLGATRRAPRPEDRARAAELEALADHACGLGVQRIFYETLLKDRRTVTDLWTQDGPRYGPGFYAFAYPLVAFAVGRKYKTRPDAVDRAKDRFRRVGGWIWVFGGIALAVALAFLVGIVVGLWVVVRVVRKARRGRELEGTPGRPDLRPDLSGR
jgi:glutathione S-transferase